MDNQRISLQHEPSYSKQDLLYHNIVDLDKTIQATRSSERIGNYWSRGTKLELAKHDLAASVFRDAGDYA
jgi:hypothetical protein